MFFSKRVTYTFLIFVSFFSIILRYPDTNGQSGADGFIIHRQTFSIINAGTNLLILHPLSYLGMYPFSEPFGTHSILGSVSLVTGFSLSSTIWLLGVFYGMFTIFLVFLATRAFKSDNLIAFMCVLAYATSFYFIDETYWKASNRGAVMVFLPFLFYSLFTYQRDPKFLNFVMILISYFLILTIHRISVFIFPTIILPFIILLSYNYIRKTTIHIIKVPFKVSLFILASLPLLAVLFYPDWSGKIVGFPTQPYELRDLFHGFMSPLLNIAFTYTSHSLMSFFAILSTIIIIFKPSHDLRREFLFLILVFQLPFLFLYGYIFPVFIITLSFLSGIGAKYLIDYLSSATYQSPIFYVSIIVLISFPFSLYLQELNTNISASKNNPETISGYGIPGETVSNAIWMDEYINSEERVCSCNTQINEISSMVEISTISTKDLIANEPTLRGSLDIESLTLFEIIFHQQGYHYGGNVQDWFGSGNLTSRGHMQEICSLYRPLLLDVYKVKYVQSLNVATFSKDPLPLSIEMSESRYTLHKNEVWITYYYNSY